MKTSFASAYRASLPALLLVVAFSIGCALAPPNAAGQTGTNRVTGISGTETNDILHLLTATNVSATLTFTTNTPHTVWTEATGIAGLAGDDQITTTAGLQTETSSTIDLMFDQYDYRGQEAVAESTGISGGPGQEAITNAAALTSTARARTDLDSVFCTVVFGVSGLPTIATASAAGILGGDAPDSLINFAPLNVNASATNAVFKLRLSTIEFPIDVWQLSDARTIASATALGISGGTNLTESGKQEIQNHSALSVQAAADISVTDVKLELYGAAHVDDTTTATTTALGITGDGSDDHISHLGTLDVDSVSVADLTSVEIKQKGFMAKGFFEYILGFGTNVGQFSTVADAFALGIDGGAGNDTILNAQTNSVFDVHAGSEASSTSVTLSIRPPLGGGGKTPPAPSALATTASDGLGLLPDASGTAYGAADTRASAAAAGITGGQGNDWIQNLGQQLITADAVANSIGVSADISISISNSWNPFPGAAIASAATSARAETIGWDAGNGNDTLLNSGRIDASATAEADSTTVGVAFKAIFKGDAKGLSTAVTWIDTSSEAMAASLGLAGGAGDDVITNTATVAVTSTATANSIGVSAEVAGNKTGLSGGAAIAKGTTVASGTAVGISGGTGNDVVNNSASVLATGTSKLLNASGNLSLNASLEGLSGSVTLMDLSSHATNVAVGLQDIGGDTLINSGVIGAAATATAESWGINASIAGGKKGMAFGVSLSDLSINTRAEAYGVDLSNETSASGFLGDTNLNTGSIFAVAGSTNYNLGIAATISAELEGVVGGVSATRSDVVSEAMAAALRTGSGDDLVINDGSGSLIAKATANTDSTTVAATFSGAWKGVSLSASLADATTKASAASAGITTGAGRDRIENGTALTNSAVANADSLTVGLAIAGGKMGAAFAMSLVDGRTLANANAVGIDSGPDNDSITNRAAVATSAAANVSSDDISVTVAFVPKGVSAGVALARAGIESTASAVGITSGAGDDTIENSGAVDVDATAYSKSHIIAINVAELGAAGVDVTTTAAASAIGLDGAGGIDTIRNSGQVDVAATTTINALDAAANFIGYAYGNVRMTNTVSAVGIRSSDFSAVQTNGETIENSTGASVKATATGTTDLEHYLVQGGGGIVAEAGAEGRALAIGLWGSQGGDTILNAGTTAASASMEISSSGASFQLSGAVLDTAGLNVWSEAAGIEAAAGANFVTNSATGRISSFASASTLAADFNVSFLATFGLMGVEAEAVARGIHTGAEADKIANYGSIVVSGKSEGTAGALSAGLVGFDLAHSLASTIVEGISADDGDDWIFNSGSINAGQVVSGDALSSATSAAMTADMFFSFSLVTPGAKAQATGIAGAGGDDTILNSGSIAAGDSDNWLALGNAYAIGGQLAGTADVLGIGSATATAIGIDGGSGNDGMTNRASGVITASARAKAESSSEAYNLAAFLLPSLANATADARATAIGINGGAGADSVDNAGRVSATAYALALAESEGTITFDIATKMFAETNPKPTANATGIDLGAGLNFAVNSGTNTATATAQGWGETTTGATFEATESESYPLPVATATGIAGGNDGNTVVNTASGLIAASASTKTTDPDNGDPSYANSDDGRDATARATTTATATGIATGSGADTVLNAGTLTASADSAANVKASTHVWYRYPLAKAEGIVGATAKGIAAGAGWNTVVNDGNVTVNSLGSAVTKSYSWSRDYRATAYSTDKVTATAMGIEADGAVTNAASGNLSVNARATTYAESWTKAENTYVTGNNTAVAVGITPASGGTAASPDLIVNDGVVGVRAAAGEDANGLAVWSAYTDTWITFRSIRGESASMNVTDAIGLRLVDRGGTIINNSDLTVTSRAQAEAYAKAHSRDYHPAAIATASADSLARGILVGNGNNLLLNTGDISVTAYADAYASAYADENVGAFRDEEAWGAAYANARAFGVQTGNGRNVITNTGSIAATAISTASVWVETEDNDDEHRTTRATGSVVGIQTGSGDDTIVNLGRITTTNQIGGQITSGIGIDAGAGSDTVALLGNSYVRGDVLLGTGDDSLLLSGTPTLASVINAGTGTDTLTMSGAGRLNSIGGLFGFERAIKTAAGTFVLPQLESVQWLEIQKGTLQTIGSYRFGSNSTFETHVYRDGSCGQFEVMGDAVLAGNLTVLRGAGPFRVGTTVYDLVLATNGLTGVFAGTNLPSARPLLRFDLNYLPDRLQVEAVTLSFTTYANNRVERAVGGYLDRIVAASSGDLAYVLDTFQQLSLAEFPDAFSRLSPDSYDDSTRATHSLVRQYNKSVQQRLDTVRLSTAAMTGKPSDAMLPGQNPMLLAYAGSASEIGGLIAHEQQQEANRPNGVWASGFGQWSDQHGEEGYTGYSFSPWGMAIGYDRTFNDALTLGLSAAYADSHLTLDDNRGSGDITTYSGAAYGGWAKNNFHFEGVLSYGYNDYVNHRNLEIGSITRRATSSHNGQAFGSSVSGGFIWQLKSWALEPFASLQYTYLDEDSFEESGAGSVDLSVADRQTQALVSELGLRLAHVWKQANFTLIPELSVAWRHDFDIDDRDLVSSFAGSPGVTFTLPGQDVAKDGLVTGAGVTLILNRGISTAVRYIGELRDNYSAHAILGELRFSF